MTNRRDLDDPRYKAIRQAILADEPVCHWCRRAKATTIDHLIEADRGGGHNPENLVPACHKCNSRYDALSTNHLKAVEALKIVNNALRRLCELNQFGIPGMGELREALTDLLDELA